MFSIQSFPVDNLCVSINQILHLASGHKQFCFIIVELHSEKVEKRRSLNEREKLDIVDKIYSQVSRDYEEEEKAIRLENRPKKIKVSEISSITDAALLCDLLDTDMDPSSVVVSYSNIKCIIQIFILIRSSGRNDSLSEDDGPRL